MTIRYTCPECSSVLKIKDDLAGADAHCPKCKTAFVVPFPTKDDHESAGVASSPQSAQVKTETLGRNDHSISLSTSSSTVDAASNQNTEATTGQKPVVKQPTSLLDGESHSPAVSNSDFDSDSQIPLSIPSSNSDDGQSERQAVLTGHRHLDEVDSDSDINEISDPANVIEDRPVIVTSSKFAAQEDEDLDSPPVFVSSMPPVLKSSSASAEVAKSNHRSSSVDVPISTRKPVLPLNEDAFDPMKFLVPGSSGNGNSPFLKEPHPDFDLSLSNETAEDSPDRPKSKSAATKKGSSSSHRAPVEKLDLVAAAKMMKRAIKDSQLETAHLRERNAEAGYDYFLFLREFGPRGFALLGGSIVMVFALYFVGQYTLASRLKLPTLGYVRGTVKLDGRPLAGATVYYAPVDPKMDAHNRARTSTGVTDDNGFFKMMYVDHTEGVPAGKCYVSVTHIGSKGNDVPLEWMPGAMVTREVTRGHQKAPADIDMVSKKQPGKN